MMRAALSLLALAIMLVAPAAQAHTYFKATLTGATAAVPGSISWGFYTHDGEIVWNANITLAKGQSLTELAIVDGKGAGAVVGVAVPVDPPLNGPLTAKYINGSFVAAGSINPAVAADETELAGHICMGHIYGRAVTSEGELWGAFAYDPRGKTETCEEAVGAHAGTEAVVEDAHAGHGGAAPVPAPPAPPASAAGAAGLSAAAVAAAVAALL